MIRALAFVLALLGALPLAAAADGRALVVAGRVMLERTAPGAFSVTALAVGDDIRSGDLIRTGSDGRIQIRFSDGAIVSLQPGTDFRIDDYRFERDRRRAFFYLLRGALRTLTGAIGKTNHDEYRMKTPTATVGVRGTEYVAEQTVCDPRCAPGPRAGLRVTVTTGRIVLLTDAGEIEVGTGQSAAAENVDAPPQRIEQGPVLPPISLSQPRERAAGGTTTGSAAQKPAAPGSRTAKATTSSSVDGSGDSKQHDDGRGEIERAGSTDDAGGADAFDPSPGEKRPPSVESPQRGALSDPPAASTLPAAAPRSGKGPSRAAPARSDDDAQAARSTHSGDESVFVESWPRFIATESGLRAAAVSPNERRSASGALLPVVETFAPDGRNEHPAHGDGGEASGGASGGAAGSGETPGGGNGGSSVPEANNPGAEPPGGEAPKPPSPSLGIGAHPIDPQASDGNAMALRVLYPWFRSLSTTMPAAGSLELDEDSRLSAFEWCSIGALCRIDRGTTKIEESGHDLWTSWGRWSAGHAVVTEILGGIPLPIGDNEGLHYLVGVPSTTIPTSGVFGYELVGATRATIPGDAPTGRLGASAAVAFSPSGARVGIDASVAFDDGGVYRFATTGGIGDPGQSQLVTTVPGHGFRGDLAATGTSRPIDCASGCAAHVDGGLFGPEAARVGITYRITGSGDGSTISGVGVFGRKTPQP